MSMSIKRSQAATFAVAVGLAVLPSAARADDIVNRDPDRPLCATHEVWLARNPEQAAGGVAGGCPLQGDCDDPTVRNAFIPGGTTPIKTLRLRIHAFANSDGSNPASTLVEIGQQVAKLNADYLPHRIQFIYTAEIINNSTYRDFTPNVEDTAMKNTYADSPATQLNVYVTNVNCCYSGLGTFPWDPDSRGNQGGIIIDDDSFDATNEVLTHEVGHCIGLWHTHHGVTEVDPCSDCHEYAPLGSNTTGDFCADTPPTKTESYGACSGSGGSDSCNGIPWVPQPANYMGYAGPPCWSLFTPQQAGRMHCWITSELASWVEGGINPCPSPGSCFASHATTGCENGACCEAVCGLDPFCCASSWDGICVTEANDLCTGCGGAGVGSCYSTHGTPSCDDALCCNAVCAIDSFCCNNQWDSVCVNEANATCNTCGGAGSPSCYTPHATAHCNDEGCCNTVCALDPYCCDTSWDTICVKEALDNCDPAVLAGPITYPTNGNKYYLVDLASWPRASTKAGTLGGHLATISDVAENSWVRANLANFGGVARKSWIGLSDVAAEGTFVWVTGEPLSYTNWNSGEPNDYFNEDYVEFYPTAGLWNDSSRYGSGSGGNYGIVEVEILICGDPVAGDCYATHGPYCDDAECCNAVCAIDAFCCNTSWDSVCLGEAVANCPVRIVAGPIQNPLTKNIFYKTTPTTWTRGEAKAVSMGGHLATINNSQENAWVVANVANGHELWIGLNDVATEGNYVWVSGQAENYLNWNAGEPNNQGNEDYVEMSVTGKWVDINLSAGNNNCGTIEIEQPGGCGDAGTGSCYSTHGAFCNDLDCCSLVCTTDSFCCNSSWDSICVNEAVTLCGSNCPADLDGNNVVGSADLGILLGAWGGGGAADLDGSGTVGPSDLGILLGAWGPCS